MLGVFVNTLTVILGGSIGLLLGKAIPERVTDAIMKGIALCIVYIGISGALAGENTLVLILSIVLGGLLGELSDLDSRFQRTAARLEKRFQREGHQVSIAAGFVTASLLFCVGAMTIVGSLQAGLNGDNEMLFTKATLDFISAIVLSSALGAGVILSAVIVFVFQGAVVLLAQTLSPLLNEMTIAEMTCVGSVLIIGLGLNLLGLTKLKVLNFMPAIFLPILLCPLMQRLTVLFG